MGSPFNPLVGYQGSNSTGVNIPGAPAGNPFGPITPLQSPGGSQGGPGSGGGALGNPGGFRNPLDPKAINRNVGLEGVVSSQYANQLAPQFAQNFQQGAGQAGDVFGQFADLGSPFYQQQQRNVWEQGVQQATNQSAQAREQLNASGYGFTPSGAQAGMIGGEAQAAAGNLSLNFLQELFQNEQLQLAGASGLGQIASMFNPAQLLSLTTKGGAQQAQNQTFAQQFGQIMSGIGSLFGGRGSSSSGGGSSGGGGD